MIKSIFSVLCGFMAGTLMAEAGSGPGNRQPQPKGYVYCPAGTLHYVLPDKSHTDSVTLMAFWMKETEVTNADYALFLKDLLDSGQVDLHKKCYPDTQVLKSEMWVGKYLNYFVHPYFRDFPVTGISDDQAMEYCKWLTKKYWKEHPGWESAQFRIPTRLEWEYAARAGRKFNSYSWGTMVRNVRNCPLAHFNDNEYLDDTLNAYNHLNPLLYYQWVFDNYMITTKNLQLVSDAKRKNQHFMPGIPVWADSYFPNDWGLYQMCGNVAELARENDEVIACGGSYRLEARYMNLNWMLPYPGAVASRPDIGFRPVMTYIPPKNK